MIPTIFPPEDERTMEAAIIATAIIIALIIYLA